MIQLTPLAIFSLVLVILLSLGVSWMFYYWRNKNQAFSKRVLLLLFALRFVGLSLIGILILGFILPKKEKRVEPANLFFLIDQSSSMLNFEDSAKIKREIQAFVEEVRGEEMNRYAPRIIPFSSDIHTNDSLFFQGSATNISRSFAFIRDQYLNNNVGAVVLVSDGNYNQGMHPRYEAEKLQFVPIHTLAVGDTTTKRDAQISNVIANAISFSGNFFPVRVEGRATKMLGKPIKVRIKHGNAVISEKEITIRSNDDSFTATFELEAKGKGIQSYQIEVSSSVEEYTSSNNSKTIYVEILESKRKVTLVLGGLHPDAGALQSILQKDQNTDVSITFLNDLKELPKSDLLVFIDADFSKNKAFYTLLQTNSTPYIYFVHPNISPSSVNAGLNGAVPGRSDFVGAYFNESFSLIQFSETLKSRIKEFPPIAAPFAREIKNIGQAPFFQKVGSIATEKPLLTFTTIGNQKVAYFYGEGIWRWRMLEFNKYQDNLAFFELWDKTLQYLSAKENRDKLRVFPPTRMTVNDELKFRAEFYNDAFQEITTPEIKLRVAKNDEKTLGNYTFVPQTRDYALSIGNLEAGLYRWTAETSHQGKKYEKSGDLIIEDQSAEQLELIANFDVLQDLSSLSSGKFYQLKDWKNLIRDLQNDEDLSSREYEEVVYANLIDRKWLFFLIVLLFALEWTLRRWSGSY